jgi:hypothetical protein
MRRWQGQTECHDQEDHQERASTSRRDFGHAQETRARFAQRAESLRRKNRWFRATYHPAKMFADLGQVKSNAAATLR